jgi:hypothetical protein
MRYQFSALQARVRGQMRLDRLLLQIRQLKVFTDEQ